MSNYSPKIVAAQKARVLKHVCSFKGGVCSKNVASNLKMNAHMVLECLRDLVKDKAVVAVRRGRTTVYMKKPVYEIDWFEGWTDPNTKLKAPRLGL